MNHSYKHQWIEDTKSCEAICQYCRIYRRLDGKSDNGICNVLIRLLVVI